MLMFEAGRNIAHKHFACHNYRRKHKSCLGPQTTPFLAILMIVAETGKKLLLGVTKKHIKDEKIDFVRRSNRKSVKTPQKERQ